MNMKAVSDSTFCSIKPSDMDRNHCLTLEVKGWGIKSVCRSWETRQTCIHNLFGLYL